MAENIEEDLKRTAEEFTGPPGSITRAMVAPLARYWLGVALDLDGNRSGARAIFAALAECETGPEWVRHWSRLRLAASARTPSCRCARTSS